MVPADDTYSATTVVNTWIGVVQTSDAVYQGTATGFYVRKGCDRLCKGSTWNPSRHNDPLIRYADILLMYAEAVNELYGPRDDAKEALKRVRRRAFDAAQWTDKVESYVESLTNETDFFQAVMDERKWEFGGEGIRKYDLARWNKYGEVIYNLYNEMTNWGLVANGAYVPGIEKVPSNILSLIHI